MMCQPSKHIVGTNEITLLPLSINICPMLKLIKTPSMVGLITIPCLFSKYISHLTLHTLPALKITMQRHSYFPIRFRSEIHLPSEDTQLEMGAKLIKVSLTLNMILSLYRVSSELQIKTQYGSIYIKFRKRKISDAYIG